MRSETLTCVCSAITHSIRVSTIDGDEDLYVEVLNIPSDYFHHRVIQGVKLMFGLRSHSAEVVLNTQQQKKLTHLLQKKLDKSLKV